MRMAQTKDREHKCNLPLPGAEAAWKQARKRCITSIHAIPLQPQVPSVLCEHTRHPKNETAQTKDNENKCNLPLPEAGAARKQDRKQDSTHHSQRREEPCTSVMTMVTSLGSRPSCSDSPSFNVPGGVLQSSHAQSSDRWNEVNGVRQLSPQNRQ